MINRDRQVIYDIFKRESIDTELLQQISKVLNHDFFSYYSGDLPLVIEPKGSFGYATKEEVADLKRMMGNLIQEFEQIRERLPQKKPLTKAYSKSKKSVSLKKK